MHNDGYILFAILLMFTGSVRSTPGSWFPSSPCVDDSSPIVGSGGRMLLLVHYQPDLPPHEVVLMLGADQLWRVPAGEWRQWTPAAPRIDAAADGPRWAILQESPALAMRIDTCTSEMWVDADPQRLQQTNLQRAPPHPVAPAGFGGFMNFNINYGGLAGRNVANAVVDVGVFGPSGAGRTELFVNNDLVRRLDSYWTHDQPGEALRLRLGDSITAAADWETPVRFGGVQWGTDFSLQPERITFPLPSISGSAALASTAQLYVNGVQQSQLALQPGQYRFDSVPTLTGAGELNLVLRDGLGRVQTVTQPFYSSPRLLEPGLDADTLESGFLREHYATADDHYAQGFFAATLQHGYAADFSATLRASASAQRQLTGVGGDYVLSPFGLPIGIVSISGAGSHTENGVGGIGTLAFNRQADDLSLTLSRRAASRDYGDLGRDPGSLHFSDTARVSLDMRSAGIGSVVYLSQLPWTNSVQGIATRFAGVAWNVQPASRIAAYASVLHTLNAPRGNSIVVGFSVVLGRGTSGSVQWTDNGASGGGANVAIQHSPPEQLGWTYAASASSQYDGLRQVQAIWTTERGSFGAGWAGDGGSGSPGLSAQTGFAILDGHAFWTRPVQNSFAVVDTGSAGVAVYRENQLAGTTDSSGRLLVPDLLPFSINRLSIDAGELPIATVLASAGQQIAPPANAGVAVHFRMDERPAERLRLIQSTGEVVPAGATVRLDGEELPLPVGYDGLVYAAIGDGEHVLDARWTGGACELRLELMRSQLKIGACGKAAP